MDSESSFTPGPVQDGAIDVALLSRYVAGDCSAPERLSVEQWLAADPARRGLVRALATPALAEEDSPAGNRAWERFRAERLHSREQNARPWARGTGALRSARERAGWGIAGRSPLRRQLSASWIFVVTLLGAAGLFGALHAPRAPRQET